jgi:hypothetical protein
MKRVLLLAALVACTGSGKKQPPPAAGPLIQAAHDLAERVCACDTDKQCLHTERDSWDAQKDQLLGNGRKLTGDDKTKFDAEISRIHMCGDGGGLTFWDH